MRSDYLKRYWLTKHFVFQVTTVARGFLNSKGSEPSSNETLESKIVANRLFDEKIAFGEKISKELTRTNTKEESISKELEKLLTCSKAESFLLKQMMMSNFIIGNNKQWI